MESSPSHIAGPLGANCIVLNVVVVGVGGGGGGGGG